MKKIWLASLMILGLCTCKTQKDLNTEIKGTYTTEWEKINESIQKGFPEKAKKDLDELILQARKNGDPIVATQAILKKMNLKNLDQEDFMVEQMAYVKEELEKSTDPISRSFLHYTLALIHNNYWQSNRNIIPDDISGDDEMSGKAYYDTILYHFNLAAKEDFKTLPIKTVNSFFGEKEYDSSLTLWDFFMLKKIEIWKNNQFTQYLGEEEQRVEVIALQEQVISKLKKHKQSRLVLLTEIDKYHYADLDLSLLYDKHPANLKYIVDYYVGLDLIEKAQQTIKDAEQSDLLQKAYTTFENVIQKGDEVFVNNAKLEIEKIEKAELQISVEQVVVPEKKALAFINYKNLGKIYLKIYALEEKDFLEEKREKGFPYKNKPIVHEATIAVPENKYKYVDQTTEFEIPALTPGFYGIVVNTSNDFRIADKNPLFTSNFLVSNLAINSFFDASTNEVVLECVNRTTGELIPGANFKVFERRYNTGIGGHKLTIIHEGNGNPDFKYTVDKNKNLIPYVSVGNQFIVERYGLYTRNNNLGQIRKSNILTDRGIYRPGQKIHYHGILYTLDLDRIPMVQANQEITLRVNDNFGNKIEERKIITDEYGAYEGVVNIPENIQNGILNFRFKEAINVHTSVRVEEYKRPKYEINFEDVNQELALGESVNVKAKAESFTGIPISDAKVNYKVYRSTWIPYFYRTYRSIYPPDFAENTLISSGEIRTNDMGEIEFDFIAERSIAHPQLKSFNFLIEIDVIDNTGESKTISKNISISEESVFVKFENNKEKDQYQITTVNAENQPVDASVQVLIYKKGETVFKVNRYWNFPDTNIVDPQDYPTYTFLNEDQRYVDLVYDKSFTISDTVFLNLKEEIGSGDFKVVIKSKSASDFTSTIEIVDFEKEAFASNELFYFENLKNEYQPGDQLSIKIGSSVGNLPVQVLKYKDSKLVNEEWITLNKSNTITESISEEDYGGYSYLFRTFYQNRFFEKSMGVNVPWNHKNLIIKPKSIRYVTEPGAPEKWTFIVTDEKGNPVKSKLLSSMYDASLDEFEPFSWNWNLFPDFKGVPYSRNYGFANQYLYTSNYNWNRIENSMLPIPISPDYQFAPISWTYMGSSYRRSGMMPVQKSMAANMDGAPAPEMAEAEISQDNDVLPPPPPAPPKSPSVRSNLAEMVFFYPDLTTDENGEVTITFDNNEALTKWKLQNFAFTKDLKYGFSTEEIITKKELMIQANQPRFLRVGDKMSLSAKVINLSDKQQKVEAHLSLYDEASQTALDLDVGKKAINIGIDGQEEVFWEVNVPENVQLIKLIYSVSGENHEDAEQFIVPVMPKDIYLIDSETILLDANSSEKLSLKDLFAGKKRTSALTIETTGSPAWYAVRSLPYLMENTDENSEAVFNRYFANSLALKILNENPLVENFYKEWKANNQLQSTLNANAELKNIDINATPWLKDAESEEEVMENMANLFDRERITLELKKTLAKLESMQMGDGGFPWYQGGRSNYFISQYILEGLLRMEEIGMVVPQIALKSKLFQFCANEVIKMNYDGSHSVPSLLIKNIWINGMMTEKTSGPYLRKVNLAMVHLKDKWYEYSIQDQVYIAKIFSKNEPELMKEVVTSLMEKSFYKEQLGRFWNRNGNQIYSSWDITLQASLISLFNEIGGYEAEVDEMKFWLIANKRTNSWKSNIATSSAIYALTLGKTSAFTVGEPILTSIDGNEIKGNATVGINYEKITFTDKDAIGKMDNISFENKNENKAWVNVHHQFFQDYADIERTENEFLDIKKEIYKIGAKDELLNVEKHNLQLGDRVKVRLTITNDRPMDFVHVSDDRPAGCEPVDLSSGYVWNNRLGYYKSIKDLGTHFFIDHMSKGKYVLEYEMFINNLGEFNSGVAEIQNYYAPEFNDYSKSVLIKVE